MKETEVLKEIEVPKCCHVCLYEKTHGEIGKDKDVWFECTLANKKCDFSESCPPHDCPLREIFNDYETNH